MFDDNGPPPDTDPEIAVNQLGQEVVAEELREVRFLQNKRRDLRADRPAFWWLRLISVRWRLAKACWRVMLLRLWS